MILCDHCLRMQAERVDIMIGDERHRLDLCAECYLALRQQIVSAIGKSPKLRDLQGFTPTQLAQIGGLLGEHSK